MNVSAVYKGLSLLRKMFPAVGRAYPAHLGGMMVLVDTSVWIRFLSGRSPYSAELSRLLEMDEVAGHNLIYGELLVGDRGGRKRLLDAYEQMYQAPLVPHDEAVAFVRARKLHGRGVGWIDVQLLASAMVGRMPLWTADSRCDLVAHDIGVAYKIPAHPLP